MIISLHNDGKLIRYKKDDYKPDLFSSSEEIIRDIKISKHTDHILICSNFDGKE